MCFRVFMFVSLFVCSVASSRVILVENAPTCFRRVLAGRRTLRSFVQKAVPCESLEDCRRECATERRFPCESFNYRIDNSFRGRGLCELMTKPIEAFDLRRDFVDDKDFDFYELDRNSLEPNCPDTLGGPGILHSGFLSSKSDNQGSGQWDRSDWDRDNKRHLDDRYTDRKHDERFVPYQIGMSRSTEDNAHWGQYGGSYGGYNMYYKNREDYRNSLNHWSSSDQDRQHGVRPFSSSNFDYHSLAKGEDTWKANRYGYGSWKRGRWNSSGASWGGMDYEEPTIHHDNHLEEIGRSDDAPIKDCSSRRRPGMSLGTGAIRRSIFARNVVDCEAACFGEREFKCVSYSYRYSSSHGSDNCYLSERPYRGLELSADSGSDVYAMPQDQDCVTINHKPWVESECFWHVRSGAAVDGGVVRAALTVAGLGACEAECIRAQGFFCRGFSFRFDSPTIGDDLENCILTSSPPTSLESGRGLRPNIGHELYARGNYGRGCEPALYDDSQHVETQCYLQYDNSARLTPSATRGRAQAKDERSCGQACTDAPFRCLSFSYNNNSPPDTDNCLLSEIRLFDLKEGVDYVHSTDDWLFAFDLFNGQCWRKVHGEGDYEETPELPRPILASGPGSDGPYPSSGPSGLHRPPSGPPRPIGPSGPTGPSGPIGPIGPSGPIRPARPIGPSGPSGIGYLPENPDHFIPSGPPRPYRPPGLEHKPGYPEISPGFRPEYPPESLHHKPYSSDSGFKPGYPPEVYKPGFSGPDSRPEYHDRPDHSSYINHKPIYRPDSDLKPGFPEIDYKPSFSSEPGYSTGYGPASNYRPGYQPIDTGYKPNYPTNIDSDHGVDLKPGFIPDNYKPGYPSRPQQPDPYRPGYINDNKPVYRPRPSNLDSLNPGYGPEDHKPIYPTRPHQPDIIKPGYGPGDFKPGHNARPEDQLYFKPNYPGDNRPFYPTRLPEPEKPYQTGFKPGFNTDYQQRPFRPVEPKPVNDRPGPYADRKPVKPVYHGDRQDTEAISVSWRHYTVSGYPCRSGTSCAQNVLAGHWACEPEGGEIGSWDYCCAPSHRCGYSEGFHKPWCYVGPSEDQWRPCSEKYYPYHQHKDPHPSHGHRDSRPGSSENRPASYIPDRPPYLSDSDRKYWDELYKNGPQAYYDKNGNPLPGYSRVSTADHPHIKYQHNDPQPGSGNWVQVPSVQIEGQPPPGGLGVPRYWPVAYLHKGPPPNMTYFRYNETTTERSFQNSPSNRELPDSTPRSIDFSSTERDFEPYGHTDRNDHDFTTDNKHEDRNHTIDNEEPQNNSDHTTERNHRDDKKRNMTDSDLNNIKNDVKTTTEKIFLETTEKLIESSSISDVETSREDVIIDKDIDTIKGIDDKLDDFSSLEVVDLDTKSLKTIEEEKQIEEIGRLLASRRGGKIILEKRAQTDLETKKIALDKDLMEFNFGNRFPERRGIIQKVTKEEINRDRKEFDRYTDKSLEVSETTFVRPPRVLSTTENIRKAVVNGKVFYEASVREQRDLFNATRRSKTLNPVTERDRPLNNTFGKKVFSRTVNPVRRVRRVYKKRYNPGEVRRRLLEKEKNSKVETSRKV